MNTVYSTRKPILEAGTDLFELAVRSAQVMIITDPARETWYTISTHGKAKGDQLPPSEWISCPMIDISPIDPRDDEAVAKIMEACTSPIVGVTELDEMITCLKALGATEWTFATPENTRLYIATRDIMPGFYNIAGKGKGGPVIAKDEIVSEVSRDENGILVEKESGTQTYVDPADLEQVYPIDPILPDDHAYERDPRDPHYWRTDQTQLTVDNWVEEEAERLAAERDREDEEAIAAQERLDEHQAGSHQKKADPDCETCQQVLAGDCPHMRVQIAWRLFAAATRYEPAEYKGRAQCLDCAMVMDPEDVPDNAHRIERTLR